MLKTNDRIHVTFTAECAFEATVVHVGKRQILVKTDGDEYYSLVPVEIRQCASLLKRPDAELEAPVAV